ncbi:palmitoyltransferase ZDHHC6-like [Ornithodoros turicata]
MQPTGKPGADGGQTMEVQRQEGILDTMVVVCNRLYHWGPLTALFIVFFIFLTSLHVTSMWWSPYKYTGGAINYVVFLTWVFLLVLNFMKALGVGPGFVPRHWRPATAEEEQFLQYCALCDGFKAPRSHHCRKCGRCVFKMDHHCPWINTCCGHRNQASFTLFLFFCVCGSIHAAVLLTMGLYKAYHKKYYIQKKQMDDLVHLRFFPLLATVLSLGLSIGVIVALTGLLYIQIKIIIRNETTIENWIVTKAHMRERELGDEFVYPYDIGVAENIKQVFLKKLGDGINWPIVAGTNQYTLTVEQIMQKADKRLRTRLYSVINPYNGSCFPLTQGCCVCLSAPLSDEPRVKISPGDQVLVSRWKTHWLYGEVEARYGKKKKRKGWFPRKCVVEVSTGAFSKGFTDDTNDSSKKYR